MNAIVAAARNVSHSPESVSRSVGKLLEHLSPPLPALVRWGDRVLVKVNLGCRDFRRPSERYSSHPAFVEAVIRSLLDCGARVSFGDDASRVPDPRVLWRSTGMDAVARRTGASLIDLISSGGREVRGHLLCPRTHLIANAVLDADVVVNVANCRSLSPVVLSGAIKNMFGALLGPARRSRLHGMFPDRKSFGRVLVDVYRVTHPSVSFLDLTSVIEGQSARPAIRPVGLMLGGTDPVAIDTVAARAIGYDVETIWTSVYGSEVGLGCGEYARIDLRGLDGTDLPKRRLRLPAPPPITHEPTYIRAKRILSHTILWPRPAVDPRNCDCCGDCLGRCPSGAIAPVQGRIEIDPTRCAACGACLVVCRTRAIGLRPSGIARLAQGVQRSVRKWGSG